PRGSSLQVCPRASSPAGARSLITGASFPRRRIGGHERARRPARAGKLGGEATPALPDGYQAVRLRPLSRAGVIPGLGSFAQGFTAGQGLDRGGVSVLAEVPLRHFTPVDSHHLLSKRPGRWITRAPGPQKRSRGS